MRCLAPCADGLAGVFDGLWGELVRGSVDRRHGFHVPVIATAGLDGAPSARSVVLRRVLPERCEICCHTDARSAKVSEIAREPRVAWTFYDAGRKLQVRVQAVASVEREGARADEAWARSPLSSRRCYLAPIAPGAACAEASPNLPEALRARVPTAEESQGGRANFALLVTQAVAIDWLFLASEGHQRARFSADAGGLWHGTWVEP